METVSQPVTLTMTLRLVPATVGLGTVRATWGGSGVGGGLGSPQAADRLAARVRVRAARHTCRARVGWGMARYSIPYAPSGHHRAQGQEGPDALARRRRTARADDSVGSRHGIARGLQMQPCWRLIDGGWGNRPGIGKWGNSKHPSRDADMIATRVHEGGAMT